MLSASAGSACSLFVDLDALQNGGASSGTDGGSTNDAASSDGSSGTDASLDANVGDAGSYSDLVLQGNPVAYWRFEETAGTAIADSSGNGHVGAIQGGVKLGAKGIPAGSLGAAFDGTGFVTFGDALDFAGSDAYSIEAWIHPDVVDTSYRDIVTKIVFQPDGSTFQGYAFDFESANFNFFRCSDQVGPCSTPTASPPVAGQFSHVVGTFDGATLRLYVNGAMVGSVADTALLVDNPATLMIASEYGNPSGSYFSGVMDEIAVYDRALTDAEVSAHYARGSR